MSQATFSLAWDAYKNSLCSGLSTLQQNGEFVDMTIAADGHFVKVHQIILALASPYIKELISSIESKHPVLFLNKISYTTLCLVLEYIYTGEVMVEIDDLNAFLEATKELHIKGLENMKLHETIAAQNDFSKTELTVDDTADPMDDDTCYLEIPETQSIDDPHSTSIDDNMSNKPYIDIKYLQENNKDTSEGMKEERDDDDYVKKRKVDRKKGAVAVVSNDPKPTPVMQYTVSNQGSLQMILNRFIYYLKHSNQNNSRQWRCVDYVTHLKCPAYVVTRNEVVLQRVSAHTHTYHDAKILKKVRRGAVFAAMQDAERMGNTVTQNKTQQLIEKNNAKNKTEKEKSLEFCSVSDCD